MIVSPEEQFLSFLKRKALLIAEKTRQLKRAEKRYLEWQQRLLDCQAWENVAHIGTLLQANLFRIHKGMSEIVVSDWELENKDRVIALNPLKSPYEQSSDYFKQSKKLRKGEIHAGRLLKISKKTVKEFQEQLTVLNGIINEHDLEQYCKANPKVLPSNLKSPTAISRTTAKPYNVYYSQAGFEVWVGKNAKCNDQLSFQYANGSDWWLHAADYPGSHVVVRSSKGKEPDHETIMDAAELALRFSKCKDPLVGDVHVTEVKWIKQVKGVPGRVMLSKHKTIRIRLDNERFCRLKLEKNSDR